MTRLEKLLQEKRKEVEELRTKSAQLNQAQRELFALVNALRMLEGKPMLAWHEVMVVE